MPTYRRGARFRQHLPAILLIGLLLSFAVAVAAGGICRAAGDRAVIRVGSEVEFPPYAFVDQDGQAAGFSVDLIKAVADAMGLQIEISTGQWDAVWNGLLGGDIDVLPIVAKSPERSRLVDSSLPHTETFDAFFTRKGDPPIPSIAGAKGKEIVVMRSDAAHHALVGHGFQGRLVLASTIPEGLSLVASGKHDAFLCSKLIGTMAIKAHGIKGLQPGSLVPDYKRVFSFAVKKGNTELLEQLNQGLLIVKTNGEYHRIYEKWLTADEPWRRLQRYLVPALAAGAVLLLLVGVWLALLQRLVGKRTRELAERNEMLRSAREGLEEEVTQRTADLRQANEALQAEVAERREAQAKIDRQNALLNGVNRIFEEALSNRTEEELGRICLSVAEQVTGSKFGFIGEIGPDGLLHDIAISDPGWEVCTIYDKTGHRRPPGNFHIHGIYGRVLKDGKAFFTNGPASHADSIGVPAGHPPLTAFLGVPLVSGDRAVGIIAMGNREGGYSDEELGTLENLAAAVTEAFLRKRAEDRLRLSEQKFATAYANNPAAITLTSLDDGVFMDVNDTWVSLTGYSREEVTGRPLTTMNIIWPAGDARSRFVAELMEKGFLRGWEHDFLKKSGEVFVAQLSAQVLELQGKKVVLSTLVDITERKAMEEALRQSEERFRIAQELSPDGFTILHPLRDSSGQIIDFIWIYENRAIARMNGTDPDKVIGKRLSEFMPAHGESLFHDLYKRVAETGKPEVMEAPYYGDTITALTWFRVAVVSMGEDIAILAQDITEHKRTESALRESEEQLRIAATAAEIGMWHWVPGTGHITVTANWRRLFGAGDGEPPTFDTWRNALHPDDREQTVAELYRAIGEHREFNVEYRVVRPDGSMRWIIDRGRALYDESGESTHMAGVNIDVTDRKRAEEELRKARDELEVRVQERTAELKRQANLLDLTHDAILVRDMEGHINYWNRGAEEMYACSQEQALGKVSHALLQARFPKSVEAMEAEVLTRGRWEGELVHTTCDNRVITVLSRWALQSEDGTPTGILEINSNITEQRNAEQQLRQGQKMEALGTLAGGIAHDFNNMLAAIIGFSELVQDRLPRDSREHRHIRRVLEASLRGRDLVKQMLTFSRRTEEEKKPLRLSSIVRETARLLRASIPTTISIRTSVKSESGVVLGDPVQIQQVVMNLAGNAAYAMRESGGVLDIELSDFSVGAPNGATDIEPGLYMKLIVRDTGAGISREVIDRIFDPFFTTKKQGEGTGLGLSVVLGIVKQSRGYITVDSEPGKGSTFTIYFPKAEQDPITETAARHGPIPAGNETILFVDDEEALVEMGEEVLAELGYEVVHRTSSREALELFTQDPSRFDLVITDQTMPEMTGVEMSKEMMRIRPDVPIILATGFSHIVDADFAKAAGIKGFVMKPLTKSEIARVIRKVLDEGPDHPGAPL